MLNSSQDIHATDFQKAVLAFRGECCIANLGGRGSGKSVSLLFDVVSHCADFQNEARPLVMRESHAGLLELQTELYELCIAVFGQAQRNKADMTITLPNGAIIQFTNIGDETSYAKLQGRTFTALYADEAGNYSPMAWAFMMRTRSNLRVPPGRRVHIHITGNPGGKSHAKIVKEFVAKAQPWTPFKDDQRMQWVWCTSNFRQNPHLNQSAYKAQLQASTGGDKALAEAWLDGSWAVLGGGMFADVWDPAIHILDEAPVYAAARFKYRIGCDWGTAAPCVGVLLGETRNPVQYPSGLILPAGTIIAIDETDTVADRDNLAVGTGASPSSWAEQLKYMAKVENELKAVPPVVHDDARGLASETVIQLLREAGIPAYKPYRKDRPGTWALLRQLLNNSKTGDGPGIYFTPRCQYLIETIPEAPRSTLNPNDIDAKYDCDHGLDALGYGIRDLRTSKAKTGRIRGNF